MQRSRGYTILEVMIFLAVSAALLGAAINLVTGRQRQVTFDQSVRDTQSKLQDWINDVATGFTGGDPSQQHCTLGSGSRPVVDNGAPSATATPDCVFLGKAIQFTDTTQSANQSGTLYAYSVFGSRLAANGDLATNLADSNPIAATGQESSGNADLTESFSLAPAQVTSVVSSAIIPTTPNPKQSAYTDSHLIGFFNSFNTEQSSTENGSEDVNAYQFDFDGSSFTPGDQSGGAALRECLQLTSGACKTPNAYDNTMWPERLQSLKVCLSDGKYSALITITSNNGLGASVNFDYESC
ncbi:MAG TPA: prepilin-type N-terminal cleavage/methylation domain-containing protein [Candidatus Saccharimonadales bacterium]|nr:prepilin-type N-terminal cleavage/methylation domain-containing protein [Candidatus Saccharimonadales bacterium]